jgi:hypothetical protein
MRDPKRIRKLCNIIETVWEKVPDWRLGQLLFNATGKYDIFYVEDDVMENALLVLLDEVERENES